MKKLFLSLALGLLLVTGVNAQEKGDWYIGTGDIANTAWTEWSVSPTVGYGVTDDLMVGVNVSQTDSSAGVVVDLHARYFHKGYFAYIATTGINTDNLSIGAGKLFTFHKGVYVDPKVVYDATAKTINLQLGVGLKF